MNADATVFVVDDDPAVRKALRWLIESVGLHVEAFATAQEFLDAHRDPAGRPGCLVLDIRMPGMSGLELQKKLSEQQVGLPVIVITGHAEVPMAVQSLKAGAVDFLEKPVSEQTLVDRIHQALERDAQTRLARARRSAVEEKLARLTPREREVFDLVVAGKSNKIIASMLGVTSKTVEAHRAQLMRKMEADNLTDLVRMSLTV
jgi:two-component system response regulator FixJ